MPTQIDISSSNYTGQIADITFYPCYGGTPISLGQQVIPYTYTNDNYQGDYYLYFSAYNSTCQLSIVCPTPTPTQTSTQTQTPTNTATQTQTPTVTQTSTQTQTPTNTPTNTSSNTQTPTPSITASQTQTPTNTPTVTPTRTQTPTPSITASNTMTPTNTPTNTTTKTQTPTPSITASQTPTPTLTQTPTSTTPAVTPTATTPSVTPTATQFCKRYTGSVTALGNGQRWNYTQCNNQGGSIPLRSSGLGGGGLVVGSILTVYSRSGAPTKSAGSGNITWTDQGFSSPCSGSTSYNFLSSTNSGVAIQVTDCGGTTYTMGTLFDTQSASSCFTSYTCTAGCSNLTVTNYGSCTT
jgi:hypothetical protein